MHTLNGGAWAEINDGCPVHCKVSDDHRAYFMLGDVPQQYELTFAVEPLRELVAKASAALAELESES
jgi:hypothetical protein